MTWEEVRGVYPDRWLVVAMLDGVGQGGLLRPSKLLVIEECSDGLDAFERYRRIHAADPETVHLFVHTRRQELSIGVRLRLSAARRHAA